MRLSLYYASFCLLIIACAVPQNSFKTEITRSENPGEIKIKQAQSTLATGNFDGAVDQYYAIFEDTTIDQQYREQALFNLAMMYSDDAQTIEDYEESLFYLRKLTSEFPRTQYLEASNRQMRYIKNQMRRMKKENKQ